MDNGKSAPDSMKTKEKNAHDNLRDHYVMLWDGDMWRHADGRMDRLNLDDGQLVLFKPWDDEEEE